MGALSLLAAFKSSVSSSPAALKELILNDDVSENCGTQNSLCGTVYTPDCCPELSCSQVEEFWICDKESNQGEIISSNRKDLTSV